MAKIELTKASGNVIGGVEAPMAPSVQAPNSDAFLNLLEKAGKAVAEPQAAAGRASEHFANNLEGRLHETMLVMEKAEITMKFAMQVRNKVLTAYQEVMRMGA